METITFCHSHSRTCLLVLQCWLFSPWLQHFLSDPLYCFCKNKNKNKKTALSIFIEVFQALFRKRQGLVLCGHWSIYSLLYTFKRSITTVLKIYSDRNKFVWFFLCWDIHDDKQWSSQSRPLCRYCYLIIGSRIMLQLLFFVSKHIKPYFWLSEMIFISKCLSTF